MKAPLKVGDVLGIRRVVALLAPVQQGEARNRMYLWACVACGKQGTCSAYNLRGAVGRACGKCGRKATFPPTKIVASTDARAKHNEIARRSAKKRRLERGDELRAYDRFLKRRRRAELKAARA